MAIGKNVHQICLDYFWFVDRYWGERLNDSFFTVPVGVLHAILAPSGAMYLGLSVSLLLGVLRHLDSLEPKFLISLVLDTEVDEIDLVRGSHQIQEELYADSQKMGEKEKYSEQSLGFTFKALKQSGSYLDGDAERERTIAREKDLENCRFIKFQKA